MIKVEHIKTYGWDAAIRGMRNPMNSHDKSDSYTNGANGAFIVGNNDLDLMHKLYKAGPDHRKYLRQIGISMDITAPRYWWCEYDTYKVGTVSNSCSTMHTIMNKEFTKDDFSFEYLELVSDGYIEELLDSLNDMRDAYINFDKYMEAGKFTPDATKKKIWYALIQTLPQSYNQKRTVTMNYEVAVTMIRQRASHKLDEWREFVEILSNLPYIEDIIYGREEVDSSK